MSNDSVIIIEQSGLGYNELVCNMMNMVPSMSGYNAMMSFIIYKCFIGNFKLLECHATRVLLGVT